MRPRMRILAGLALVALLAALIYRISPENRAGVNGTTTDSEKQRVRRFWEASSEANRLRLTGDFEAAIDLYRECLDIRPKHEDSLYYLGLSLEEVGEYEEAASVYRRLGRSNPSSNRAFAQLGQVLATPAPGARIDFEEAERAFQACVELNREHSGPYLNLGRLRLNQGHFKEALEYFRTAVQFGSAEANLLAGYTCLLQGRKNDSLAFLRQVLDWYSHERKVAEHGAVLEGDLFADAQASSPQQLLAMQAVLYRVWAAPGRVPEPSEKALVAALQSRLRSKDSWKEIGTKLGLAECSGRAAWADFNRDGRVDVVCGSRESSVRLYRNTLEGFVDVTKDSGLKLVTGFWDAAWGDYDLDGRQDLYVIHSGFVRVGENHLYRNNGDGTFVEVGVPGGLGGKRSTFRAFFVDLDGDKRPELVEIGSSSSGTGSLRMFVYRNGQWSDQAPASGLKVDGTVADSSPADFDQDGDIDLFVYRWGRPSLLFRNEGGRFDDATELSGLAGIRSTGFSSLFFDYDHDGFPDLLVSAHGAFPEVVRGLFPGNTSSVRPTLRLFRNLGPGRFEEVTEKLGLTGSFGAVEAHASDLDGDGWPDLILANGSLDALRAEPSAVLRNHKGKAFELANLLPSFERPANSLGISTADVDGDGRPEIYLGGNLNTGKMLFPGGLFTRN